MKCRKRRRTAHNIYRGHHHKELSNSFHIINLLEGMIQVGQGKDVTIAILDIIRRPVFYLENDTSGLNSVSVNSWLLIIWAPKTDTESNLRNVVFLYKILHDGQCPEL
jgi:hypothetical protein